MTDAPSTPAEYVGIAFDAAQRLARNRHRWMVGLIGLLVVVIAIQGFVVVSEHQTIARGQTALSQLQSKSNEQTVAEVQLRDDVNTLTATNKTFTKNHTESVRLFCSILSAVHDTSTVYMTYCPVKIP